MRIIALTLCLTLLGCGSSSDPETEEVEDKETVFDPLVENLDKANAVEEQIMEQKRQMDKAIAESEGVSDDTEEDDDD
jgi:hypothetical protein